MLDKEDYIKRFDSNDALSVAANQYQQLQYSFDVAQYEEKITQVVVAGMGGSALAAQLVQTWWLEQLKVPFVIIKDYDLPKFVDKKTLVICSSYSGNTEETLSMYEQARAIGSQVAVITSGGKLYEMAQSDNWPVCKLPLGYQPRMAVWYGVRALSEIMQAVGLIDDAVSRLEQTADFLRKAAEAWDSSVATEENQAKQIAEECMGKAVWVYSGPKLKAAAYKWKININENAKHVASWNELPEFNHNEILGWTHQPVQKPFTVIELMSSFDNERVRRRFEVTNKLLSGRMPHPVVVEAEGDTHIAQLLWACLLGDFASIYLAVLNNVNPTQTDIIEKFKKEILS